MNGKQLVFTFMSATVVAVVVFLCGVMVGRGVQVQPASETFDVAADADPAAAFTTAPPPSAPPAGQDDAPPASRENLTYPGRLEGETVAAETLKPTGVPVMPASLPVPVRESAPPKPPVPSAAAALPSTASAGSTKGGFVVQVAATRERKEADAIVRRLVGKGYPAFVTLPASGPRMFRVRVGTFADRRQAESTATRLRKEEQFKPWITR